MITVRAGRMPGRISSYEVEEGATVNDVLGQAGLDPNGFEVRIGGSEVPLETEVEDGQDILLFRKIKGNGITVRAGRMPGRISSYEVEEGATVNDVLGQAGLDPNGFEVRIGGSEVPLETEVEDGQDILLFRKIKGNSLHELRVQLVTVLVRYGMHRVASRVS